MILYEELVDQKEEIIIGCSRYYLLFFFFEKILRTRTYVLLFVNVKQKYWKQLRVAGCRCPVYRDSFGATLFSHLFFFFFFSTNSPHQ